jgi:predicted P-loop ATPase
VARTFQPGCEVHTSLILSGKQGTGKTSLFKMLAPAGSYVAKSIDPSNKDMVIEISRYAIAEWGELSGLKKADLERLKDYWSATFDDVRTPYARRSITLVRRGIIVGSDNSGAIFVDPTGGRRFWVVPNGPIDLGGLAPVVRQLWAEALVLYRAGHQWHLTGEEEASKGLSDVHFTPTDPWAEKVEAAIKEKTFLLGEGLTISNLCDALDVRIEQRELMAKNLAKTLRKLGYESRRGVSGERVRYWYKPATNQEVPEQ